MGYERRTGRGGVTRVRGSRPSSTNYFSWPPPLPDAFPDPPPDTSLWVSFGFKIFLSHRISDELKSYFFGRLIWIGQKWRVVRVTTVTEKQLRNKKTFFMRHFLWQTNTSHQKNYKISSTSRIKKYNKSALTYFRLFYCLIQNILKTVHCVSVITIKIFINI